MLRERIEGKWIDCFAAVFAKCGVVAGDSVAILSETQSRQVTVELSELGLLRLGCRPFHLVVPSPRLSAPLPCARPAPAARCRIGAGGQRAGSAVLVVDAAVEGLLRGRLPQSLAAARGF
jgi:2,5-dihydroxypyridine 5,6-dioxygenase